MATARTSLADRVRTQEKEEPKKVIRNSAVNQITSNDGSKDKQISAKVNDRIYKMFTEINKANGISNNSCLNMLMNKYVRENKGILEEKI